MAVFIHALLLDLQAAGNSDSFTPLNVQNFLDDFNFSPLALQQSNTVSLSFAIFPPLTASLFSAKVLSGMTQ